MRYNMEPSRDWDWWTPAVSSITGAAQTSLTAYRFPSSLFRAGSNTIAVEVKQADGGYDDMLFDLIIIAPPVTPNLLTAFQPSACVSKPENDPTLSLWSTLFPTVAVDAAIVIEAGQRVLLDVTTLPRLFSITIRCVGRPARVGAWSCGGLACVRVRACVRAMTLTLWRCDWCGCSPGATLVFKDQDLDLVTSVIRVEGAADGTSGVLQIGSETCPVVSKIRISFWVSVAMAAWRAVVFSGTLTAWLIVRCLLRVLVTAAWVWTL
jgi:hypothetical protein